MRHICIFLLLTLLALFWREETTRADVPEGALLGAASGSYRLDPAHSAIRFECRPLGMLPVDGRFGDLAGSMAYDAADPDSSVLDLSFTTTSVDTGVAAFDSVARGGDWLDAANYPQAAFHAMRIDMRGDAVTVTGDLTLHGQTHGLTVSGTVSAQQQGLHFTLTGTFRRSAFGLANLGILVPDEVPLHIDAEYDPVAP